MFGKCHICGKMAELSFEHVPPRAAFNDNQVVYFQMQQWINKSFDNLGKGKIQQRGLGSYTLCPKCNNDTGRWYGNAFRDFAIEGMRIIKYTNKTPTLYYNYNIFPLRVFKQIICMFLSANGPDFHEDNPGLVRFVLNKNETYYESDVRIFLFYNYSDKYRKTGVTITASLDGEMRILSEITFPPFGYLMSIDNSRVDSRLTEITFLKDYYYNDWKTIPLKLNLLPVYSAYPADYRSKEEIDETVRINRLKKIKA